jgi:hypothetical protein
LIKKRSGTFFNGHSNRVKSKEQINGSMLVFNKKKISGIILKGDFSS